ncbi:MAG TPA: hypothetical protein VGM34_02195 [Chlamydiales bacterium]
MSFFPPTLTPIAQGIQSGAFASLVNQTLDSFQKNREESEQQNLSDSLPEPLVQMFSQRIILSAVNEALMVAGRSAVASSLGWVFFLTPAVAFVGARVLPKGVIQSNLEELWNKIGSIYRVAFIASQIAILYFTPGPAAIACLIFIATAHLHQSRWLSGKISGVCESTLKWLPVASYFFLLPRTLESYLKKGLPVAGLLLFQRWLTSEEPSTERPDAPGALTASKLKKILQGEVTPTLCDVNMQQIDWSPLPSLPPLSIKTLLKMWDAIPWDDYPRRTGVSKKRTQLEIFIQSFDKEIPPTTHEEMRFFLIAEELKKKNAEERAQLLYELVDDKAEDSDPLDTIKTNSLRLFAKLTENSDFIPFRKRVLQELQMLRTALIYKRKWGSPEIETDLATSIRAQLSTANAEAAKLTKKIFSITSPDETEENLKIIEYIPLNIIRYILSVAKDDPSFKKDMEIWWNHRLEKFPEAEKAEIECALGEQEVTSSSKVLAMLYDLNILQDKKPAPARIKAPI